MRIHLTIGAALAVAIMALPTLAAAEQNPSAGAQATANAGAYTQAQAAAFAHAQAEMEPLNHLPRSTDAERQAVFAQMRAVLDKYGLTAAKYNEMVGAMRTDPDFARRVGELAPES
jgi:Domain of unknown function (DUF4168)